MVHNAPKIFLLERQVGDEELLVICPEVVGHLSSDMTFVVGGLFEANCKGFCRSTRNGLKHSNDSTRIDTTGEEGP